MGRYIRKRLLTTIVVLFIVSFISFCIMQLVPGDPALIIAGIGATEDQVAHIREQFGLDQPFVIQLFRWYRGLAMGDLGQSVVFGQSVIAVIADSVPVTLSLTLFAFVMSIVTGIPAGIVAALNRDRWPDRVVIGLSVLGLSVPSFWLGLLIIVFFSVELQWLPSGGYVPFTASPVAWMLSLILPAFSLALLQIGYFARISRAALVEVLSQDYMRSAEAKGLPRAMVVGKHALRNALLPIVTVVGIVFSLMLSGSVVIETVFSLPGLGRLMATAILSRDYPVIQGTLLLTAASFALINLAVDLLYVWIDPRVSYD